jgi:hypothetical protein
MKINLGTMQINQIQGDRTQLWTLPTIEGYPQYDLGGAIPGTPLPGQAAPQSMSGGVAPAAYSQYPTTPYPVTPAYGQSPAAPAASNSGPGPLPRYGQRRFRLQ